jgi:lipopolysaccharide assembly protein A
MVMDSKMNFKNISLLILLALFIIVCIQNVEIISVQFLFWKAEISKLLLLIITLIIGILIGIIIQGFLTKSKKEDQIKVK